MTYAVVIETGTNNLSAYVPDLPGCVATGRDYGEVLHNIREAIILHLDGMVEDGEPIPEATTIGETVEVPRPVTA
jgi:predicted RNase H-like HicB family nuclease